MKIDRPDLSRIWATSAPVANVEDPDITTPGKFDIGWAAEVPTYQNFNYLQRHFTRGLAYLAQKGVAEYNAEADYYEGSLVNSNGGLFMSTVDDNTGNTLEAGSNWMVASTITSETFAGLQSLSPTAKGQKFVCVERDNAPYTLQADGYVAEEGDLTFANGRIARLTPTDYITLKYFGVNPNSGNNETAGITAAIDYHLNNGIRLFAQFGEYLFDGIARISTNDVNITGIGVGNGYAIFKSTDTGQRTLRFESVVDTQSLTLASNASVGESSITVTDASGISEGMLLRISSNVLWPYDNRGVYYRGELHLVESVDANVIKFVDTVRDNYTVAQIDNISAWTPSKLVLQNIAIDQSGGRGPLCIQTRGYIRPQFKNIVTSGSTAAGIWSLQSWETRAEDIYANFIGDGVASGYGMQDRGGVGCVIKGLYTVGCRRSFDAESETGSNSALARDYKVIGFTVRGGGAYFPDTEEASYGIGNHGPSQNGLFANGKIYDCKLGINHRGSNLALNNIDIYGKCDFPVDGSFGSGFNIDNVNYYPSEYPLVNGDMSALTLDNLPIAFVRFGRSSTTDADFNFDMPVKINNCTAVGIKEAFIYSENITQKLGNIISGNNHIQPSDDSSLAEFSVVRHSSTFSRSSFANNHVELSGRVWQFCNGLIGENDGIDNKYAVKIDGEYVARIADDDYVIMGIIGHYIGARPIIGLSTDAGGKEIFEIRPSNALTTTESQSTMALLDTTATAESINGTFGVDGRYTIGLSPDNYIYLENRGGSDRNFRMNLIA